ncbi:MAG: DUF87 domain-containing protein [Sedimentisphaerales bacterium]
MADRVSSDAGHVRELCLRLKPILGSQMDRVFAAYCAEDIEGRKQIEKYLELATAKYLPQKLEQLESDLIPPSKEQAEGEYSIGFAHYAGKDLYEFGLREDEWIQHVAVLGRSGAGKTNVGFVLLRELTKKEKPFLVFDWKRNYRDLISQPEFKDVEVYTIGRNTAPLQFNPLIPPTGTNPKTWLKKLNEVIAHSYCLGNGVLFLLQQAVDAVYEDAGVYDGTVQFWPTFKDVLVKARNMDARGRESGWLSSTLRALSSLCFGDMDKLLNTGSNKSLGRILEKNIILELDALTQSDKVFFVEALLLWLHHTRMAENRRENFKHAILIEEAHHILSDERRSLVGGQSVMEIIFREIREFGESLILLDQHPSKISLPALGNTYTTICMNLKHKTDINAVAQCLLLDKEKELLGSLEVGEAVVKLQGRIPRAFQVRIPEFVIHKGTVTDDHIRAYMKNTILSVQQDSSFRLSDEYPSVTAKESAGDRNDPIIQLLRDIQDYPDSGIAARYKRLGLSVRQGQKLKAKALELSLAHERPETTRTGRQTLTQLTEKGKAVLGVEAGPGKKSQHPG